MSASKKRRKEEEEARKKRERELAELKKAIKDRHERDGHAKKED